jgi:glycosyltransferase involved in cell wall biosynthesis
VGLAFAEAGCLAEYVTGFVWAPGPALRIVERSVGPLVPTRALTALNRRRAALVPSERVRSLRGVDLARTIAAAAGWRGAEDRLWERDDHRFAIRAGRALAGCDVVHAYEHAALELFDAARSRGIRTVLHMSSVHPALHDAIFDAEYERYPEFKQDVAWRLRERRLRRDARRIAEYALADAIVVGSSLIRRSLVENRVSPQRIDIVPLGAALAAGSDGLGRGRSGPMRALFAGKVSFHKGCHRLLQVWPEAVSAAATLTLAGANDLPGKWTRTPGAIFAGPMSQPLLFELMANSDLLVLPTLCDSFGLVVVEALAHGLPVLTTANAGAADLIDERVNGWIVPAADNDALGRQLAWCEAHLDEVRAMRRRARTSVRGRSWAEHRADLRRALDRRGLL